MTFQECLNSYIEELQCSGKELAGNSGVSETIISRYRKGDRVPTADSEYLKKLSARCGLTDLHPHKLRHTFASVAITNGADVASVSEALGHADKSTTLRMYTHASAESISRTGQIVRDAIKKAGQG